MSDRALGRPRRLRTAFGCDADPQRDQNESGRPSMALRSGAADHPSEPRPRRRAPAMHCEHRECDAEREQREEGRAVSRCELWN